MAKIEVKQPQFEIPNEGRELTEFYDLPFPDKWSPWVVSIIFYDSTLLQLLDITTRLIELTRQKNKTENTIYVKASISVC